MALIYEKQISFQIQPVKGCFWHQSNITLHLCLRDDEQPSQMLQSEIPATETAASKADVAAEIGQGKQRLKMVICSSTPA